MKPHFRKHACLSFLAVLAWSSNGEIGTEGALTLVRTAEAVIGRPATPVSYAGVARRSTVGPGAPGVGVRPGAGPGGPASGIGVLPGAGAGRVGVGRNAGGPVNRVGRR